LGDTEGLDKLLFELASESRLGILRELSAKNLKMQEVARQLDLTATDAFRQLQRLSDAMLIRKQPDGSYTTTQYGRLVLQSSSSLEFLEKHKEYFLTHDLLSLPLPFVNRIGELSGATLSMDAMANINKAEQIARDAGQFFWGGGGEQPMKSVGLFAYEQASRGVKFRFLFPEKYLPDDPSSSGQARNIEWRGLSDIPVSIVVSEKEAGISFSLTDGRADYAGFIGTDPAFISWAKDLFLYYWEKGIRV
jgi:predicted transcriptional regulator